jgi:hypothetical protein
LLAEPMVMASGRWTANGVRIGSPSRLVCTSVSSTTAMLRCRVSAPAMSARSSSVIQAPVGLWKSGIRKLSRGAAWRSASSKSAARQPSAGSG